MKRLILRNLLLCTTLAAAGQAQIYQRQASMVGGGNGDRGKCTVEVLVDDVAQVEIRGATATVRTLSGQPAQIRRFECTAPLPANPGDFRFEGVDGRGRQSLVRDPRNGGTAVVQIEDRDGGAEGYTFDLVWDSSRGFSGGNGQYNNGQYNNGQYNNGQPNNGQRNNGTYNNGQYNQGPAGAPIYRDQRGESDRTRTDRDNDRDDQYRPGYRDSDYYHRYNHGFAVQEAVRVCQREVERQAVTRFRSSDIHFYRTSIDDNAGREDWVVGTLDVHRGPRLETYNFSCSVNFENGRVRSAQLDSRPVRVDVR